MSLPTVLHLHHHQTPTLLSHFSLSSPFSHKLPTSFKFTPCPIRTFVSFSFSQPQLGTTPQNYQHQQQDDDDDDEEEEHVIGDCVVFEDGIFEESYVPVVPPLSEEANKRKKLKKLVTTIEPQNLVPDQWRDLQELINITKKERRKLAQEMEFCARVDKKKSGLIPLPDVTYLEYKKAKLAKLAQLKPLVLDNPNLLVKQKRNERSALMKESDDVSTSAASSGRVVPRNPRMSAYGGTLEDISEFFSSGSYQPGDAASNAGPRKLFTKEEKIVLSRRSPDLEAATSAKWLPLHTLAASGEFYLVDTLFKHNVDVNAADKDGLTALHKAIICKKQAIANYLLRNSADAFVCDKDGATLMHYAVRTASSHTIKILLLYNVDINQPDKDGWTPLHVAVQARRTDLLRLLLLKGADKTLKNKDGLTPLDLCLYSGQNSRTYELIRLLKILPRSP